MLIGRIRTDSSDAVVDLAQRLCLAFDEPFVGIEVDGRYIRIYGDDTASTKSAARRREQKKRWFRNGQKWRTGCEGRISVVKRRHGLSRCRYRGDAGMKRWVGLGVIADNLISMGNAMARQAKQANPPGP